MGVLIRHFAGLRERRGCAEEQVELRPAESIGQLYLRLFPPSAEGIMPVMYAVNLEYVPADHVPKDGDEVAFIPPLGGG